MPAYEDPAHFLLVEQKLPINVEAGRQQARRSGRARALDPRVRARHRRAGQLRAADPGLAFAGARPPLGDGALGLRRGKLFLMPGDSPAGFRLPLSGAAAIRADQLSARAAASDPIGAADAAAARERCSSSGARCTLGGAGAAAVGPQRSRRRGPHRADHRAARRASVRLHAAGGDAEDYRRAGRRRRGDRRRYRPAGPHRRLHAARSMRASTSSR